MTDAEREHIVRQLAEEFTVRTCTGHVRRVDADRERKSASGDGSVAGSMLDHMVRAGASRFGVCADQPERYAFSACDLAPPLARMIDHTALKPETTEKDIASLCSEAERYCFASVCVNPSWVEVAAARLRGTPVRVCTVVGFPLGATATGVKAVETETAVRDGASEIDMVLNVGRLRSGHTDYVEEDIRAVVTAARRAGAATVKVILETALLSDQEKVVACVLARNAGADFVKTSTGFSKGGATAADVALMRRVVGSSMGVKASGGVRSRADAERMIASGATRIGASASVAIIQDREGSGSY